MNCKYCDHPLSEHFNGICLHKDNGLMSCFCVMPIEEVIYGNSADNLITGDKPKSRRKNGK